MTEHRNILERALSSLFKRSRKTKTKQRKLGLESLEVREMLSVSPLQYPPDPDDAPPSVYAPQFAETTSLPTVEVEAVQNIGREGIALDPLAPIGVTVNNGVHPCPCPRGDRRTEIEGRDVETEEKVSGEIDENRTEKGENPK